MYLTTWLSQCLLYTTDHWLSTIVFWQTFDMITTPHKICIRWLQWPGWSWWYTLRITRKSQAFGQYRCHALSLTCGDYIIICTHSASSPLPVLTEIKSLYFTNHLNRYLLQSTFIWPAAKKRGITSCLLHVEIVYNQFEWGWLCWLVDTQFKYLPDVSGFATFLDNTRSEILESETETQPSSIGWKKSKCFV